MKRRFEILLVEDNPGGVRLNTEALRESGVEHALSSVVDGVEALVYGLSTVTLPARA